VFQSPPYSRHGLVPFQMVHSSLSFSHSCQLWVWIISALLVLSGLDEGGELFCSACSYALIIPNWRFCCTFLKYRTSCFHPECVPPVCTPVLWPLSCLLFGVDPSLHMPVLCPALAYTVCCLGLPRCWDDFCIDWARVPPHLLWQVQ
jgi:hypothetical protein